MLPSSKRLTCSSPVLRVWHTDGEGVGRRPRKCGIGDRFRDRVFAELSAQDRSPVLRTQVVPTCATHDSGRTTNSASRPPGSGEFLPLVRQTGLNPFFTLLEIMGTGEGGDRDDRPTAAVKFEDQVIREALHLSESVPRVFELTRF